MKTKIIVISVALLATPYPTILLSAPIPTSVRTPKAQISTPGESLVFDPASGDYTITYADNSGNLQQSKFVPATKIEPVVSSAFQLNGNGIIAYRYTIANGKAAKQPITMVSIYNISSFYNNQSLPPYLSGATLEAGLAVSKIWNVPIVSPARWHGNASPDLAHASMVHVSWSFSTEEYPNEKFHIGVSPGERQTNFGFVSRDLPAIGQVKLWGDTPINEGYVDEGPNLLSVVGKQLNVLETNNFVLRKAAIPTITVPDPFDPAVTLNGIQTQMHTWISMQLLDAAFSSQLDRYFQSAIDAYRRNQPKVAKEDIEKVREMLKKEHQDLGRDEEHESEKSQEKNDDMKLAMIDRLAALVLDFDLKYVLRRASGDKDD